MDTIMPEDAPQKSTLFCPRCEHASRVDGDWLVVDAGTATRYVCPGCDATVTRRPHFDAETEARGPLSAWTRCWRTWGEAMSTWGRASYAVVTDS